MSDYESKAREMVAKAEKKMKGYSFFGGMGAKYDDAADLLERAGNNFKLAKACECRSPQSAALYLKTTTSLSRLLITGAHHCCSQTREPPSTLQGVRLVTLTLS